MPMGPAGYRRALLNLQRQHRRLMARLIAQVEAQLAADWQAGPALVRQYFTPLLDEYARALAALRAERDDPFAKLNLSWLTQRNTQLRQIEQNLRTTVQFYAQQAAERITQAQQTAANLGEAHAGQLLNSALEPARTKGIDPQALWNRPNPEALAQFIGRAGNGHPLGDLFGGFSQETASAARQALMTGLALGDNPKVIARGLDAALGIPRQRALVIARTEVLGSYRSAAHTLYRANSDVVEGWLWSAGGNNPCAMCMGMDGTLHGLYEELNDHPCGKCAPIPTTKTWDQILGGYGIDTSDMLETSMGYPGAYESGEVKFARMSPEQQRAIIGTKTGYEAYKRGEVTLRDFVGVRPGSDGFPSQYYQRSLKEMQIPTRQASRLVEPEPALAAKLAAGKLRASDLGKTTPDALMPAWAKQSEASRIVYQVLRNGLPYPLTGHEQGLLIVNLEQMLKGELPVNVRAAVERQLQALGQQVERQTVGAAAREAAQVIEQTASKDAIAAAETEIKEDIGRAATHIAPEDVAAWTANNAEGVPAIGYHYTSEGGLRNLMEHGIDVTRASVANFGNGFYMFAEADPMLTFGTNEVQVAIHMEHPLITDIAGWEVRRDEILAHWSKADAFLHSSTTTREGRALSREFQELMRQSILKDGYDGLIMRNVEGFSAAGHDIEIIAIKPGTVRIITPSPQE